MFENTSLHSINVSLLFKSTFLGQNQEFQTVIKEYQKPFFVQITSDFIDILEK